VNFEKIKHILINKKYLTQTYDLSGNNHPLDLIYDDFKGLAANIPIERCRSNMLGYKHSGNPFVNTLVNYSHTGSDYSGSPLESFYKEYCPTSMKTVLNSNNSILEKYHPMATVMPWSTSTPERKILSTCVDIDAPNVFSKEAFKLGLPTKNNYGWQYFGPVSQDLGELEYKRLTSVYNAIKKDGYHPDKYGYIHGQFLISDQDWVWVNIGGKHRFASLAALNVKTIPVALRSRSSALFIHRSDVDYWPNVKNGLFEKQDALDIFDSIISGKNYYSSNPSSTQN
jgi:hypothetical protein